MNTLNKINQVKSRIRRRDYIITSLSLLISLFFIFYLLAVSKSLIIASLSSLFILFIIFASISSTIGRIRDIEKSPWPVVILYIPFIGLILGLILLFKNGTIGPNKYGEDPKRNSKK